MRKRFALSLLFAFVVPGAPAAPPSHGRADPSLVRGITISCQTWGWEWGTPGFADELADLAELGANWVAIHPYARVHADGRVTWRPIEPDDPPTWLRGPIEVSRERRFGLLVKPHLAYWGSPFRWRGEIRFDDPAALERFWRDYTAWIVEIARATRGADAFAVGTELELMLGDEKPWRALIEEVRAVTDAHLTYAANWTAFDDVPFWDALDAIGVQGYFPLSQLADPSDADLMAGWEAVLPRLRRVYEHFGKPVVFTELGYNRSLAAAREPWAYPMDDGAERARAEALQERCLRVGLQVIDRERDWLRGAFLWKWFVGEPGRGDHDFRLDTPGVRAVLADVWR